MVHSQSLLRSSCYALLSFAAFISGCATASIRPDAILKDGDALVLFNTSLRRPMTVEITSFNDGKSTSIDVETDPAYWLLAIPAGGYSLSPATETDQVKRRITWWDKTQFEARAGVINYIGDFLVNEPSLRHTCDMRAAEAYLAASYPEKSRRMLLVNKCLR